MMTSTANEHDAGLGLVELIVAVVVSGIVIVAMATIFVNSWRTQQEVLSVGEATNRGQLVGSMIEKAVRNAEVIQTPVTDNTLRVWTSLGTECQGVALDGAIDSVRISTTDGSVELPDVAATWSLWSPPIDLDMAESSITSTGRVVSYTLVINTDSAPVRIEGTVSQRTTRPSTEVNPCW